MKNTLNLLWKFKWVSIATLVIECLILLPVLLLMLNFGDNTLAINYAVTSFGSSGFLGVFVDAMGNHNGLSQSVAVFAFILPFLFLIKLALASGTVAIMQNQTWSLSLWLSESGKHLLASIGLFLRWLFVPLILCGLCLVLIKFSPVVLKKPLLGLLAIIWFFSFSWLTYALNVSVNKEKRALIKGFKILISQYKQFIITTVVFAMAAVAIKLLSWNVLLINGQESASMVTAIVLALLLAIATRVTVLFWQASHVTSWLKIKKNEQ